MARQNFNLDGSEESERGNAMKKLPFSFEGRALEVRMVQNGHSFVGLVWEGANQVSSVPYTVSEDQVRTAEARDELEEVLDAAMDAVRDTVTSRQLPV